jgi:hypothetical protein
MKKISIGLLVIAAVLLLLSASVWEGSAAVAAPGALPESGYYAATNSFPRNTVVDITNLANGRTIRVIVAGGLETPGLLVMLSRDAAGAIELQSRSIGRVKMSQPADPVAFARFTEGKVSSGDPDFDPAAALGAAGLETAEAAPAISASGAVEESGAKEMPVISDTMTAVPAPDTLSGSAVPDFMRSPQSYEYALEEAGAKVPEAAGLLIDEKDVIAPTPLPDTYEREYFISEAELIPPVDESRSPAKNLPVYNAAPYETIQGETSPGYPETNNFSVPVISDLEKGKYYIQLAALSKVESVENEIKKIDSSLPMAVQGAGSSGKPIYRVLVGPVNLGESGALLRRFKAIYKDAFVRGGN